MTVALQSVAGYGKVRAEWEVAKIPAVVFFQEGPGLRQWQWTNAGMKVINVTNILGDGRIDTANTRRFISLAEFNEKYRHFAVDDGDIVIASSGNTYGKVGRISAKDLPVMMNTSVIRLRSADKCRLDEDFLYAFLRSDLFRNQMEAFVTGSAQPNFGPSHLKQMVMPLPPLPVQLRIAGILSAYDDLIKNNQRRIKILEEMAQSLYREWFVHFRFPGHDKVGMVPSPLGLIPQGWEVKKLGDLTTILSRGISPTYDDEGGDSTVINQKCIRNQRLSLEPARRQSKPIPQDKRIRFGDVLINSTGVGTLGRVAQVYEDLDQCTVDTHVTIVRPKADTDVDFFGCALLLKQEDFERLGIGATGQTELSRAAIGEVKISIPPESLQKRFGTLAHSMRTAANTLSKQTENLRRSRDLLLPRLLSGQVHLTC